MPPVPPNTCIYCGRSPTTKEHFWTKALAKFLPKLVGPGSRTNSIATRDEKTGGIKVLVTEQVRRDTDNSSDPHHEVARVVCSNCNNEWMERIQTRARDSLLALIGGDWSKLDPAAAKKIAAFIGLFVMTSEFTFPGSETSSPADRAHMKKRKVPPDHWVIAAAPYEGTAWHGNPARFFHEIAMEGERPGWNAQTTVFVMGSVLFYCTSGERLARMRNVPALIEDFGLTQLWPSFDVRQPRAPVSDIEAAMLAVAFLSDEEKKSGHPPPGTPTDQLHLFLPRPQGK
jgi:hypothetical protein